MVMNGSGHPNENSCFMEIVRNAVILMLLEIILFFCIGAKFKEHLYGLLLGGFVNILFFRLMYLNIVKVVDKKIKNIQAYIFMNYIARYCITGLILFIAATNENISLYSCFLGLLSIKIVIHIQNFWKIFLSKHHRS